MDGNASTGIQPTVGTTLAGRFELLELLGSGGMGVVFKARGLQLHNTVCVKLLREQCVGTTAVQRLQSEAKALATLQHPNIVRIISMEMAEDQMFLVTEFIDGISLQDMIDAGPIPEDRIANIIRQVADGLQYAHEKGVVHRDVKPSNIMVSTTNGADHVKILDFGIAKLMGDEKFQKLTKTGAILGTPHYMSPEQCTSGQIDARTDIYSLGCVLYHCVAGKPPFEGENALEVSLKHSVERAPTVAGWLGTITACAMEKDPALRFQTAAELSEALRSRTGVTPRTAPAARGGSGKDRLSMRAAFMVLAVLISGCYAIVSSDSFSNKPDSSAVTWNVSLPRNDRKRLDKLSRLIKDGQKKKHTELSAVAEYTYLLTQMGRPNDAEGILIDQMNLARDWGSPPHVRNALNEIMARFLTVRGQYLRADSYYADVINYYQMQKEDLKEARAVHDRSWNLWIRHWTEPLEVQSGHNKAQFLVREWRAKNYNRLSSVAKEEIDFAYAKLTGYANLKAWTEATRARNRISHESPEIKALREDQLERAKIVLGEHRYNQERFEEARQLLTEGLAHAIRSRDYVEIEQAKLALGKLDSHKPTH